MRVLTEKGALGETIKMWGWLAETGMQKGEYDYGEDVPEHGCYLCEYAIQQSGKPYVSFLSRKEHMACPYYRMFRSCYAKRKPYAKWEDAIGVEQRKKYAKQFLEQLYQLRNKGR